MTATRVERIRTVLEQAFSPSELVVTDDSAAHAGHAGAATGKGHFSVQLRAAAFTGKSRLQRHRMVYAALDDLLKSDVHALAVKALAAEDL